MSAEHLVAKMRDIPESSVKQVMIDDRAIAVYHLPGGEFYATSDVCTHGQAFLSEGWLNDDGQIECPLHGGCFDVRTGDCMLEPAEIPLQTYEVKVVGEDIFVIID